MHSGSRRKNGSAEISAVYFESRIDELDRAANRHGRFDAEKPATEVYMASRTYALTSRSFETHHGQMQRTQRLRVSGTTYQLPKAGYRGQRGIGSLVLRLSCE